MSTYTPEELEDLLGASGDILAVTEDKLKHSHAKVVMLKDLVEQLRKQRRGLENLIFSLCILSMFFLLVIFLLILTLVSK